MSARLASLACAAALASLACGGEEAAPSEPSAAASGPVGDAQPAPQARGESETAADEPGPAAIREKVLRTTEAENDRVSELLEIEPEGDGLDTLIAAAADDPDPAVREAAVIALGDSDDPRALDALIAASEDRDRRVVLAAIDQLGWADDRLAEDALRRLTRSPDAEIAAAATEELDE
jgi:hypothetical protein